MQKCSSPTIPNSNLDQESDETDINMAITGIEDIGISDGIGVKDVGSHTRSIAINIPDEEASERTKEIWRQNYLLS